MIFDDISKFLHFGKNILFLVYCWYLSDISLIYLENIVYLSIYHKNDMFKHIKITNMSPIYLQMSIYLHGYIDFWYNEKYRNAKISWYIAKYCDISYFQWYILIYRWYIAIYRRYIGVIFSKYRKNILRYRQIYRQYITIYRNISRYIAIFRSISRDIAIYRSFLTNLLILTRISSVFLADRSFYIWIYNE